MLKFVFEFNRSTKVITIISPNINTALIELALKNDLSRVETIYISPEEEDEEEENNAM